jgi:hypothetical protein
MSRLRHEAGQTIVLIAVLLPLFLGLGAIAVDVGYWYVVKKTAQDAADAAALAAAAELPDKFAVEQAAQTYVHANMPDASWTVEYPYVPDATSPPGSGAVPAPVSGTPDPTKVEVTVAKRTDTLFGRIFGVLDADISSRAVAERLNTDGDIAMFAHSSECVDDLEFVGTNTSITGYVHTNGQFLITQDPDNPNWWAHQGSRVCGSSINPVRTARFGGSGYYDPTAEQVPRHLEEDLPWPTWYTPGQLGISWPVGCPENWRWEASNTTIPPGIYCAQREIRIDADNVQGRVTLVAPKISIDGDRLDLAPFTRRLLMFVPPNSSPSALDDGPTGNPCDPSTSADAEIGGERYTLSGTIFSPCGRVRINVGEARDGLPQITGSIVASKVSVLGDNFTMVGRSNFDVNAEVALSE